MTPRPRPLYDGGVARLFSAAAAGTVVGALAACGISARGQELAPPDAVLPDAAPNTGDATADTGGGGGDAGSTQCVTFANTIAPFTYEGEAGGHTVGPTGVSLAIAPAKAARIFHTFSAPKVYARTRVDAHIGMSFTNSWGPSENDYMTLLQLFHGPTRVLEISSRLDVTMAQNVIELNAWAPIQFNYGLGGMRVPGPDTHLIVTTDWASGDQGRFRARMDPPSGDVGDWELRDIPTTATGPTDQLTVVIGGSGVNVVPTVTLVVFDVCVTFDPP